MERLSVREKSWDCERRIASLWNGHSQSRREESVEAGRCVSTEYIIRNILYERDFVILNTELNTSRNELFSCQWIDFARRWIVERNSIDFWIVLREDSSIMLRIACHFLNRAVISIHCVMFRYVYWSPIFQSPMYPMFKWNRGILIARGSPASDFQPVTSPYNTYITYFCQYKTLIVHK